MPCEHYKDALIEAAASGSQPQGDLHAHLDACAACRAAFEREQSLFASIDAGLHVTANAGVPASLLPRVRAHLDVEATPNRSWVTNWLVMASTAAIIAAFFVARAVWGPVVRPQTNYTRKNPPAPAVHPAQEHTQIPEPSAKSNSLPLSQTYVSKNSHKPGLQSARSPIPEVLVPQDQEVLLTEYAEQWRLHKRAPLLAQDSGATILASLQVAPIQIAELDVRPLAEEKSQ